MDPKRITRRAALIAFTTAAVVGVAAGPAVATPAASHAPGGSYAERVVVSDHSVSGAVTDPKLVNPWGIAFGPTTPLWVSNQGTSTSTIYTTNTGPAQVPLIVSTQPAPTGIVFNDTTEFTLPDGTASKFLFDSLSGQLSAWGGGTATTTTASVSGTAFTGLALAHTSNGARLFAADSASTNVLVYNGKWQLDAILRDRNLPAGLSTYNVAVIGSRVYVSYAVAPGATAKVTGAIDVYSLSGRLERRLVTGGALNGPWGMVKAPMSWGRFGGALLVGNEDGGHINAFNATTGRLLGTVRNAAGNALGADGLWGMQFGNGLIGTANDLVIAIGTSEYQHGVIALIHPTKS
jgi:uncharacterized protein (TIGR03118 family)